MISERMLRKWRRGALTSKSSAISKDVANEPTDVLVPRAVVINWSNIILRLTQELLDIHLLKKGE